MQCEIITIGDEILIGQVVDTNSAWMARSLNEVGVKVARITSVQDEAIEIKNALDNAFKNYELVLMTGGLGPTRDDITKKVLCEYFKTVMVINEDVLSDVRKYVSTFNELNRKQAEVPQACNVIRNMHGTAPGMWFDDDNKVLVSMPGVPSEMEMMMKESVLPKIKQHFTLPFIIHKNIVVQGIAESELAIKLDAFENELPLTIKLAYLPSPGHIRLRLSFCGSEQESLIKIADELSNKLALLVKDYFCGNEDIPIEQIVGNMLASKGLSLSTAESCTGGNIAHMITSVEGSSAYFKGSVVAYANEVKIHILDVPEAILLNNGAVSKETVEIMASNVRKKFKSDYAISVSGIAGPGGGTDKKPVGTVWIAIASPEKTISTHFLFGNNRERNIIRASITALNMLRKVLMGID